MVIHHDERRDGIRQSKAAKRLCCNRTVVAAEVSLENYVHSRRFGMPTERFERLFCARGRSELRTLHSYRTVQTFDASRHSRTHPQRTNKCSRKRFFL